MKLKLKVDQLLLYCYNYSELRFEITLPENSPIGYNMILNEI